MGAARANRHQQRPVTKLDGCRLATVAVPVWTSIAQGEAGHVRHRPHVHTTPRATVVVRQKQHRRIRAPVAATGVREAGDPAPARRQRQHLPKLEIAPGRRHNLRSRVAGTDSGTHALEAFVRTLPKVDPLAAIGAENHRSDVVCRRINRAPGLAPVGRRDVDAPTRAVSLSPTVVPHLPGSRHAEVAHRGRRRYGDNTGLRCGDRACKRQQPSKGRCVGE